MPGVTAAHDQLDDDAVEDALRSVCFDDRYASEYVIDDDDRIVAYTGYDEYPVEVVEIEGYTVVLEGYLYGADDVEGELTDAAELVGAGRLDELSEWVAGRDGDFLVVVIDREDDSTWVMNDMFGRLPTYRATVGGTTVVTRELKVIRKLARSAGTVLEPNTLALGQFLWFGHPLGTRTLFEGVEQLPPGSLIDVGADSVESVHEYRFDEIERGHGLEANAERLANRFVESCRNRASVAEETVVSLSGGLDSRASIAGFTHDDGPLIAATSARKDGGNAGEVDVARRVANALGVPWKLYVAERTDGYRETLLETKQGMNSLSMSLGLDFADQVAVDHPGALFITGDGGDKTVKNILPSKSVESVTDLVEVVIDRMEVFDLEEVTEIVDTDADALVDSVRERIDAYPESTLEGRYVHFIVREQGPNWSYHGEDRTRYYLWSTTPFYYPPFFMDAMACPPEQKQGTELYRTFLDELAPAVTDVDYFDFGTPIDSLEYRIKRFGYDWLSDRPALKQRVLGLLGQGNASGGAPPTPLAEETGVPSTLDDSFSSEAVQRVTWSGAYDTHQQYLLLTLVSALDWDPEDVGGESPEREERSPISHQS